MAMELYFAKKNKKIKRVLQVSYKAFFDSDDSVVLQEK